MKQQIKNLPIAFVFFVFSIALSGCYFDPIALPYLIVNRVFVVDGIPYLHALKNYSYGLCGMDQCEETNHYFLSQNNGKTWWETQSPPSEIVHKTVQPVDSQKTLCSLKDTNICFRIINGKEQVQASNNRGVTWMIDWQMPAGRQSYMQRTLDFRFEGVEPDSIPYDLAILETSVGNYVIVAMGNQGVIIRNLEGMWIRYTVSSTDSKASPLPYHATSLNILWKVLEVETLLIAIVSLIFFVVFSVSMLNSILPRVANAIRNRKMIFFLPVLGAMSLFCISINMFMTDEFAPWAEWIDGIPEFLRSLFVIGVIIVWLTFVAISRNQVVSLVSLFPLITSVLLFFCLWLPFGFWGLGIIPIYKIAMLTAFFLGTLILIVYFRIEKRIASSFIESSND